MLYDFFLHFAQEPALTLYFSLAVGVFLQFHMAGSGYDVRSLVDCKSLDAERQFALMM